MCGIGGILRTDGQPIPEEWLDAIDARIAYRGPDGHGRFRDRVEIDDPNAPGGKRVVEVAFVHRRLSIIDHKDGHQPMVSERGRNDKEGLVAVVFNGCIYNHRELRRELEAKGHRFVTDHSDTEVLIHGWREWGEELIDHLEGMYAYGLWDRDKAWLTMGRDQYGEKPLYIAADVAQTLASFQSWCAFASDARALTDLAKDVSLAPPGMIDEYLRLGYISHVQPWHPDGMRSSTRPILELVADSSVAASASGDLIPLIAGAWQHEHSSDQISFTTAEFEHLIEQAVNRRLEADVPVGCFLSGGVDSSLVALMAKRHKDDIKTFTVRMPDDRYDESRFAQIVADHLHVQHSSLTVSVQPAEDLLFLIRTLGQPFGDSSILPTHWISKAARQHVKVALSGDGADELFLGYERYTAARSLARYRRVLGLIPHAFGRSSHPKSLMHKLGRLGQMARDYDSVGIQAMSSVFSVPEIADLTATPIRNHTPPTIEDALDEIRSIDLCEYLPGDLLRKVDTASMACGLEVRCPFLDRDLARAALAAPIEQLMPGGQRKGLLRQIARKYLPKEIVDRPKMGFAIPIGEWFRSDYGGMKTLLLDHLNSTEPFGPVQLNRKAVQRFIDEHMSGKRDHGQRLFTLLTLSIWARQVTSDK